MSAIIQIIDGAKLLEYPPPKIEWALKDILPLGTVGDVFGPPGEGKSSLTLDFAIAVASGAGNWFGLPCVSGPVALLGGERSGIAAFSRDLHRASQGRNVDPGMLVLPQNEHGDCPPMWAWDRLSGRWVETPWGGRVNKWLIAIKPVLILVDTLASAASGSDIIDQPQQYSLGIAIRQWAKMLGDPTVLMISHTNQSSAIQEVARRLHYLSRAGGNGLPGALRWVGGVSRLRGGEMDMVPGGHEHDPRDPVKRYIAVGVSKHNEMALPLWTPERPAIFQMTPDGAMGLVPTTPESFMAHDPEIAGDDDKRPRKARKKKADSSRRDNEYWQAKNGEDHVSRW